MAPRPLAPRWLGEVPMARDANAWIDREIAGCRFADEQLGRRLRALLAKMRARWAGASRSPARTGPTPRRGHPKERARKHGSRRGTEARSSGERLLRPGGGASQRPQPVQTDVV